jgi:hypothetical protein
MMTFTLTDTAEAKATAFAENHISPKTNKKCALRPGSVGDLLRYDFVPTGIGDFCTVYCACGARCPVEEGDYF